MPPTSSPWEWGTRRLLLNCELTVLEGGGIIMCVLGFPRKQGGLSGCVNNKTQRNGVIELTPQDTKLEAETCEEIDAMLEAAGRVVQDKKRLDLYESWAWSMPSVRATSWEPVSGIYGFE